MSLTGTITLMDELGLRLENAESHFRKLADRMRDLHSEVLLRDEQIERERENLNDRAREVEELVEHVRDVQRGIRTLDEVLGEWDHDIVDTMVA